MNKQDEHKNSNFQVKNLEINFFIFYKVYYALFLKSLLIEIVIFLYHKMFDKIENLSDKKNLSKQNKKILISFYRFFI